MVTEPLSMDELFYHTNRTIKKGKVRAWVYRGECPECKGIMGKPVDEKTGKPKIRSKEYVCKECGHIEEKEPFEETLTLEAKYTCPHCGKEGESETPFKWKNTKVTIDGQQKAAKAVVFPCQHCNEKIAITKKMK